MSAEPLRLIGFYLGPARITWTRYRRADPLRFRALWVRGIWRDWSIAVRRFPW